MVTALQVGDRSIDGEQIISLLRDYQLLPQLIREIVIDRAIAPFACTLEERESSWKAFCNSHQIGSEEDLQTWLGQRQMNREGLISHLDRALRIEKFKYTTWGNRLKSYFLKCKADLDRVVFSMVSTHEEEIAQELYFRLQEGEQSFADLAPQYARGAERDTFGIVGPIALGQLHPTLKQLLTVMQVGQLWTPVPVDRYLTIVRLEKRIPARLDEAMQQTLLQDLLDRWLQEQLDLVL
jgi:parvulin-like peptidyl-prolyl isomerase